MGTQNVSPSLETVPSSFVQFAVADKIIIVNAFKQGHVLAVVLAAINTAIAIYYYLSVVRVAYCSDPEKEPVSLNPGPLASTLSVLLLLVIVIMGVVPGTFLKITSAAVGAIL